MGWWKSRKDRVPMGRLSPVNPGANKVKPLPKFHPCDGCGLARDGSAIADAQYEIVTPKGSIFLCAHHMNRSRLHFMERAYEVKTHFGVLA